MTNFLDSVKEKPRVLMYHRHYEVEEAILHFEKYFTDCELQEEQIEGRFWFFIAGAFYILLDNELVLFLSAIGAYDGEFHINEEVIYRENITFIEELQGYYYD